VVGRRVRERKKEVRRGEARAPCICIAAPALPLMEFRHTTMATPSPNNSTTPSGHGMNAGSQSQHITTMSGVQGECPPGVPDMYADPLLEPESSRSAAVKVNVGGGRVRLSGYSQD